MIAKEEGTSNRPTVLVPPWPILDDASVVARSYSLPVSGVPGGDLSPYTSGESAFAAFHRLLSSSDSEFGEVQPPVDPFSSDEFRIYEFKVRRCARGRSHDWTECPFAHPGEKARRRDPRKYCYSGTSCSDFRKGHCKKGDACEFAHGVFESWLHPERYRTQPCKDGTACRRRVCFFAHTPEQLRVLQNNQQQNSPKAADSYDGSPLRLLASLDAYLSKGMSSSPTSTLVPMPASPPSDSPPISPLALPRRAVPQFVVVDDMIASMKRLQLSKCTWGVGQALSGFRSPEGLSSATSTPTAASMMEMHRNEWCGCGRKYGANVINGGESPDMGGAPGGLPDVDVGWVSELVK